MAAPKAAPLSVLGDTLTVENLKRFVAGDLTWAELVGITPLAYASMAMVGRQLYHEGKLVEARTVFDALSRANPRDPYAWTGLGAACQLLDEPEEARAAYDRALALDPHAAAAQLNRAELLLSTGAIEPARGELEAVAQREPVGTELGDRARGLLQSI